MRKLLSIFQNLNVIPEHSYLSAYFNILCLKYIFQHAHLYRCMYEYVCVSMYVCVCIYAYVCVREGVDFHACYYTPENESIYLLFFADTVN